MGSFNVAPLSKLVEQFERLPGIGSKTAQRLAYFVLNMDKEQAQEFSNAIIDAHEKIRYCDVCCNFSDQELCPVCRSNARDKSVICVVETPRDAIALENTHEFDGVYHVLHGAISPLNGIGPDQLYIKQLLKYCFQNIYNNTVTGLLINVLVAILGQMIPGKEDVYKTRYK